MTCEICATPLPPYGGRGRPRVVCSRRCHNWKRTHGVARPTWLESRACARCQVPICSNDIRVRYCSERCRRLQSATSAVDTMRACKFCDSAFKVVNGKQVYCSTGCRVRYNRRFANASALRRTARRWKPADPHRFTLLDVADRTGWVCGLCLAPIDPAVRGDRRLQATVDHIIPLSRGGRHELSNVQLAHWTCNAAKRDSTNVVAMSVPDNERRVIIRWLADQLPSLPIDAPGGIGTQSAPQ